MRTQGGLESEVALKVLRRDLDPRGQSVQRLRDEGRLLARLDHPVILRVHDLALLDGRVTLVTEYIAGEDLETLTRGREKMGPRSLLEVVAKVSHALDAAWNAPLRDGTPLRLVHRDIKPSNIRIGKHGEVKLLDFGIAKTEQVEREARTQTDMMVGSPAYMAPERFRTNTLDPASDVFALGATLLEGLTGRRFYGRMEIARIAGLALDRETFEEHVEDQLGHLPRKVPDAVQALIADTLKHDPAERISAAVLADRSELLAEGLEGLALARWCRARTWRPEKQEQAELSGKSISEGTLSVSPDVHSAPPAAPVGPLVHRGAPAETAPVPQPEPSIAPVSLPPPASGPSWSFVAVLLAVVFLAGVLGLASAAGLGGLAYTWRNPTVAAPLEPAPEAPPADVQPAPEPPVDPIDPEPSDPAPEPNPTPAPEPKPAPAPAPRPDPAPPAPSPTPAPTPVAPQPAPAPAPAPVESPGRVTLDGANFKGMAMGPSGVFPLPSDLPPGTWTLRVSLENVQVYEESLQVSSDQHWRVVCSPRFKSCKLEQVR